MSSSAVITSAAPGTKIVTPSKTTNPSKNVYTTPSNSQMNSYDLMGTIDRKRRSEHLDISPAMHITPPNNNIY